MTESTKKLITAIESVNEKLISQSSLIFSCDEGESIGRIYHDGLMWSAAKINASEININELKSDGVTIWRAVHYIW